MGGCEKPVMKKRILTTILAITMAVTQLPAQPVLAQKDEVQEEEFPWKRNKSWKNK